MFNGDVDGLVRQIIGASMIDFEYTVYEDCLGILYSTPKERAMIIAGVILCGLRHIEIHELYIIVFFDEIFDLEIIGEYTCD